MVRPAMREYRPETPRSLSSGRASRGPVGAPHHEGFIRSWLGYAAAAMFRGFATYSFNTLPDPSVSTRETS